MEGNRYLVTGATGGIGFRVCELLHSRGASLVVAGRDKDRLNDLTSKLSSGTRVTSSIVVDLSSEESTELGASSLTKEGGDLNGVVLIYPGVPKSVELLPAASEWRQALDLCFINPLSLLRAALPLIKPDGRIVVVSGIAGIQVFPSLPFSNSIRAAWLAEVKTLSFGLGKRGIRINTVSLGGTLTERFSERLKNRKPNDIPPEDSPENIPLGEYGDPLDAAALVCAFIGDLANHVTGANIVSDGGLTRVY